ncbi:MAG: hypothetical protein AVDCRST_MAG91-1836 [uncultured Sphingomonadaceae bacterium]|uniref:Uncharacterized protein n=1 Tax=uncultured Sphingomonadaceae bacterium TaxID=169976 RepID=A0A6J4T6B9_9SPHN|nr:MAG: hypothetical protein AVDCRST_MAG91-1836 [uncultured Sphingomonadaceae bacterium]
MTIQRSAPALPDEVVRAYAAGEASWREIRERTGIEDFAEMLQALGTLGLRLPRASTDRPSRAKEWMREILAERMQTA